LRKEGQIDYSTCHTLIALPHHTEFPDERLDAEALFAPDCRQSENIHVAWFRTVGIDAQYWKIIHERTEDSEGQKPKKPDCIRAGPGSEGEQLASTDPKHGLSEGKTPHRGRYYQSRGLHRNKSALERLNPGITLTLMIQNFIMDLIIP
jgi:hypothetical protein